MNRNLKGKELGGLIAEFYRELIQEGLPQEDALELSRTYLLSIGSKAAPVNNALRASHRPGIDPHEWVEGEPRQQPRFAPDVEPGDISDPHDLG